MQKLCRCGNKLSKGIEFCSDGCALTAPERIAARYRKLLGEDRLDNKTNPERRKYNYPIQDGGPY